MLTIPEKLLLLALHDTKGTVVFSASTALPYGLAGSVLIELLFREKISIRDSKVQVSNSSSTGDELFDDVLTLIHHSKKVRSVKYWVQKIESKMKNLKSGLIDGLIDKGILQMEKHKILGIFPTSRFPLHHMSAEQEIKTRVHQVIIQKDIPDDEDIALLTLIDACDLYKEIFSKEDRKQAKKRIKEITAEEQIGQAIRSIITEITAAVTIAVTAATAASAATN